MPHIILTYSEWDLEDFWKASIWVVASWGGTVWV